MLRDLAARAWQPQAQFRILDLGCGTGLSGVPFRSYASRLDGIDLASGMIENAARRGSYDTLTQGEIHEGLDALPLGSRSEEHTSELQSLMRISYAVFCLK